MSDNAGLEKLAGAINFMRRQDEVNSSLCPSPYFHFSHACRACNTADPRHRVIANLCGHVVCRECADGARGACPRCAKPASFARLIEDELYSRDCAICMVQAPLRRAVFVECGHAFCRACVQQLMIIRHQECCSFDCPLCRVEVLICPITPVEDVHATIKNPKAISPPGFKL